MNPETDPREFYVSARVVLPGGEHYQQVGNHDVDGEGRSRAHAAVPLTRAEELPECVFVAVYDHLLQPVFDEELCAESSAHSSEADALAYRTFMANLRELPPSPTQVEPDPSGGCSTFTRPGIRFGSEGRWLGHFYLVIGACLIIVTRRNRA